jgi:hypothetical protein
MNKDRFSDNIRGPFSMTAGWLFADLLLVLAMLFLAANTMGVHPPPPPATATPTPPKVQAQLEQRFHRFVVPVNRDALLRGDAGAVHAVKQRISGQSFLKGRSAGLVVAYGTISPNEDCQTAYTVASEVYSLVRQLGQSDPATFGRAVMYDPLCNVRNDVNQVTIDIFLFVQNP